MLKTTGVDTARLEFPRQLPKMLKATGPDAEKTYRQRKDLGMVKGYLEGMFEILPLQNTKEKQTTN